MSDDDSTLAWLHRITHELLGQLAFRNETFKENPITIEQMGELVDLVQAGKVTGMFILRACHFFEDIGG